MKDVEIINSDFDLFYRVNNRYNIHIATAGGVRFSYYGDLDFDEVVGSSSRFWRSKLYYSDDEIVLNPRLSDILQIDANYAARQCERLFKNKSKNPIQTYICKVYAWSFILMAKHGVISFDRTNINDKDDEMYHWVACPNFRIQKDIEPFGFKLPSLIIPDFKEKMQRGNPFQLFAKYEI